MKICKELFLSCSSFFLYLKFVRIKEIIMPENVGYISELTANYCNKGLGYTVLGPTGMSLCLVLNLTFRWLRSCQLLILHHGNIVSLVIVPVFGLVQQRHTSVCCGKPWVQFVSFNFNWLSVSFSEILNPDMQQESFLFLCFVYVESSLGQRWMSWLQ